MKKLALVLVAMFMFAGVGMAQKYELNFGTIKLYVPFQDASAVALLDLNHDCLVMSGAETSFGKIADVVTLNAGGVTSEAGKGTPYGSLGYTFIQSRPEGILAHLGFDKFEFGIFGGYDFSIKDPYFWKNCRVGLKFSTSILGMIE